MPRILRIPTAVAIRQVGLKAAALFTLISASFLACASDSNQLIQQTCIACHNEFTLQAGLNLQSFDADNPHLSPVIAEKVIRKLRTGQMPPRELPRDELAIDDLVTTLESALDRHAKRENRVGSRPFQRVNRAEYERLIYDLLGLTVDASTWLPEDRISASFDNIADSQDLSATLMISYLTAASDIARQAGADPNVRLKKHRWYSEFTTSVMMPAGLHQDGATPFWRAAQALDVDAMRLLKSFGAEVDVATIKIPKRRRGGRDPGGGEDKEVDHSGIPAVELGGPFIFPVHVAAGAGYGQYFMAHAHRHAPNGWLPAVKFLIEDCGADVNARDGNGYTPLHHAASRGDNTVIQYLLEKGADVMVVSRKGETTVDIANGPTQRVSPFPDTIVLLEGLGAKNNHNCVSC